MAAGEYLKSAAASLHQAANHLQQQARELRGQLTRTQADKQAIINRNSVELKTKQVEHSMVDDEREKSRLSMEIDKLQKEIVAAQQQMHEAENQLKRAAEAKIGASGALEDQAKQLEGKSSAPELN